MNYMTEDYKMMLMMQGMEEDEDDNRRIRLC